MTPAQLIEQYKMDLMQDGDVVVDGSETLTFTVQPQAALTVMDQSTGEVKGTRRRTRRQDGQQDVKPCNGHHKTAGFHL